MLQGQMIDVVLKILECIVEIEDMSGDAIKLIHHLLQFHIRSRLPEDPEVYLLGSMQSVRLVTLFKKTYLNLSDGGEMAGRQLSVKYKEIMTKRNVGRLMMSTIFYDHHDQMNSFEYYLTNKKFHPNMHCLFHIMLIIIKNDANLWYLYVNYSNKQEREREFRSLVIRFLLYYMGGMTLVHHTNREVVDDLPWTEEDRTLFDSAESNVDDLSIWDKSMNFLSFKSRAWGSLVERDCLSGLGRSFPFTTVFGILLFSDIDTIHEYKNGNNVNDMNALLNQFNLCSMLYALFQTWDSSLAKILGKTEPSDNNTVTEERLMTFSATPFSVDHQKEITFIMHAANHLSIPVELRNSILLQITMDWLVQKFIIPTGISVSLD
ncbi:MAG: hypothetical protein JSS82_00020 [Bacteroidetes bacterium]|nr:hypothetical protein [Bacteroidota bacterium]